MLAWQVVKNFFARTQDASDSLPLEVRSCPSSQTQNCACYIWLLSPFSSWEVNLSFALAGGGSHQNPVRASSYSNPDHLPRHRCSSGVGCTYINMRTLIFCGFASREAASHFARRASSNVWCVAAWVAKRLERSAMSVPWPKNLLLFFSLRQLRHYAYLRMNYWQSGIATFVYFSLFTTHKKGKGSWHLRSSTWPPPLC